MTCVVRPPQQCIRREGGGGSGTQKCGLQNCPDRTFLTGNFAFSHEGPFGCGGGGGGRALLEGEGGASGQSQSGCRAVTGDVKAVGGGCYWRLEMRLGRVLGYGNAFGVGSGQWGRGEGDTPDGAASRRYRTRNHPPGAPGMIPGAATASNRSATASATASNRFCYRQLLLQRPPAAGWLPPVMASATAFATGSYCFSGRQQPVGYRQSWLMQPLLQPLG